MEVERTEDLGVAQVLPISVGGKSVVLRTLSSDESDVWLRRLTGAVDIELGDVEGTGEGLAHLLGLSAHAGLELIAAYDIDGTLGDHANLGARMTKREVHDAVDAMAVAEDPFGEGAARLVDEVFGAPSSLLATMIRVVKERLEHPSDGSSNGAFAPGASTTTETSDRGGAKNGSSSSGSTGMSASARKRRRSATSSRTA